MWQSLLKTLKVLGSCLRQAIDCKTNSEIAACCLKDELRMLRLEVTKRCTELSSWLAAVAYDHRSIHPGMLRCILAIRGLQTDLSLLAFMIYRYPESGFAWCTLSNLLPPILEEAAVELEELISEQWNGPAGGPHHPLLDNFLSRYTEEIYEQFLSCENQVEFEIRMMELLLLCPCGNLEVEVSMTRHHTKKVNLYSELRNLPYPVPSPEISKEKSKLENQRELLSFLIHYIKSSTAHSVKEFQNKTKLLGRNIDDLAFSPDFNEIISFLLAGDECSLEKAANHETFENVDVFKVFSSKNSGNCVISYSFEVADSDLHITNQFVKPGFISFNEISRVDQMSTCQVVKCIHPIKINYFAIEIKGEGKTPYNAEKMIVQYEYDENNYKLLREEYSNF